MPALHAHLPRPQARDLGALALEAALLVERVREGERRVVEARWHGQRNRVPDGLGECGAKRPAGREPSADRLRARRHGSPLRRVEQPRHVELVEDAELDVPRPEEVRAPEVTSGGGEQRGEEGRLEGVEVAGRLAEVLRAGRLRAPDAVAPFDDVQVELEDASLREYALQAGREEELACLSQRRRRRVEEEVAGELLGDGAAAHPRRTAQGAARRLLELRPV